MKVIKYEILTKTDMGEKILTEKEIHCSDDVYEANLAIAKTEAYNGVYTVENGEDLPAALTVEERLAALEKTMAAPEYTAGTWYYRGDKVSFERAAYTCIAPQSVVCVWSPAEYPVYWQKG